MLTLCDVVHALSDLNHCWRQESIIQDNHKVTTYDENILKDSTKKKTQKKTQRNIRAKF